MGVCQANCFQAKKAKIVQGKIEWTGPPKINAKKSTSAKVWTSNAFNEIILRFLDPL